MNRLMIKSLLPMAGQYLGKVGEGINKILAQTECKEGNTPCFLIYTDK